MRLDRLLKNVACDNNFSGETEISLVTHDSRAVGPGALFICLRGENADGHDFIDAAIKNGAAAIVADEKYFDAADKKYGFEANSKSATPVISVPNTRQAMARISANFYDNPAEKMRLIGVTGTNGKTTTTYFIDEILRKCGRKTGLIGTVCIAANGKPLDIPFATSTTPDPPELHKIFAQMLALGVRDVVMEVSSHALALYKMEGLVFDVGVFTNLTQDHLDFHGTMDNYRAAKARLFSQSRFAVVNADDESTPTMLAFHGNDPFLTYGIDAGDLRALHISFHEHTTFDLEEIGGLRRFVLNNQGRFNVYNSLAAIGVAEVLGVPRDEIQRAFNSGLSGVPGRIQSVPNTRGLNVLVDYAHSPDGLKNIIAAVRECMSGGGRVFTLFGCGGDRDREKRPIMGKIAGELSDYCFLTSDNPRTENPAEILAQIEVGVRQTPVTYEIIENRRDAIFAAVKMLKPGDALIIAGKGHEDYQEIGAEKHHFDDFKVATKALGTGDMC
ncbi:MAG: UDP-N-acetylmuramoyl-L-alanyl-D-glutamate--2,6-diaminopimelate ligase [Defluviitaleaceae bacterium]|nr:UDP-N-acetylmuramoyl-L-alanyl-D-glutamate--2,6-diaminopimelate ligase [Defluviitaleaceae bacterium]